MSSLELRLHQLGCESTRVRVLVGRYPDKLEPLVARMESLAATVKGDNRLEDEFNVLCNTWYLDDENDDQKAIAMLKSHIAEVETSVKRKRS